MVVVELTGLSPPELTKLPLTDAAGRQTIPVSAHQPPSPGLRMKKACEARLRDLLASGEPALAVGVAEELDDLEGGMGSGGGWTFLVLSPRRVLFADWGSPHQPHGEIALDAVTRWADGTQYGRYALMLTHSPMARRRRSPSHSLLWFTWGEGWIERAETTTTFRFSKRYTEAAKLLRSALESRGLHHEVVPFDEVPRKQRTSGSRAYLRAKR